LGFSTMRGGCKRQVRIAEQSSGKIFRLDKRNGTAELLVAYYPPPGTNLLSKSQGSTQIIGAWASGAYNVLVNWGSEGAVTEYTADGEVVFHAEWDSGDLGGGVQNYRAFKGEWTGRPREEVALVVEARENGRTGVYVSWNGDTETRVWRFWEVPEGKEGDRLAWSLLGDKKREGFETELVLPGLVTSVAVEAVDGKGKVLRRSAVATVDKFVLAGDQVGNARNLVAGDRFSAQAPLAGQ
jgi:hypothetical protein